MRKILKKIATGLIMASMLAAVMPTAGLADGEVYGTASLETKLDNDIVVYENRFADNSALAGITALTHSGGGAKIGYKEDFVTKAKLPEANYGNSQLMFYNGEIKTKSKGFWINLDNVLETYGPGAYTFSFRVNSAGSPGLIEAVLNTAENQADLEDIIWNSHNASESSPYLNLGGHVLCSRWDSTEALNNVTYTSTTYISEDAEHLRFFFGGTDYDGAENNRNVSGNEFYKRVFIDDIVITKKANSYKDPALENTNIKLKSTITPLGGVSSVTGTLVAAMYDADTNALLNVDVSEEITTETPITVESELPYPNAEDYPNVSDYVIKTFFIDGSANFSTYTLSYNPHESLMPNVSFEAPFTNAYRWIESNVNIPTDGGVTYNGERAVGKGITSGGTWIKVGEGEVVSPGTSTAPGSQTALSKMLLENGKGTYKFSFMAKTRDGDANLSLHIRPYYQNYSKGDTSVGVLDTASTRWTVGPKVATTEWQKFEFEVTFNPLASGETVTAGNKTGWLSYRKNNYGLYLIGTSVASNDAIYIDDFQVTKISD